tara:strand:- start:267596 stop:269329 length:1734 start_codon:yes stop_codon:yes gene_type:complete
MKVLSKIFILSVILLFVSCTKRNPLVGGPKILHVPLSGEISTVDPANSYDTISASIIYQCYEQLYQYHYLKRPYTLEPLLAKSLPEITNNGKTYTIKIKEGIKYHDHKAFNGTPRFVKAQDFITQIKRLAFIPTQSNGWWLFDGRIVGLNEFRNKVKSNFELFQKTDVKGLSAPDDHTLVINLTETYPQMLFSLAMSFTSPVPLEVVISENNILNRTIVGTGPFKLESLNLLSEVVLNKNPEYRDAFYPKQGDRMANIKGLLEDAGKKIPFIDGIKFSVIKEAQTRWLNFRKKNIDLLVIPKDNYTSAIDPSGKLTDELKKEKVKLQVFPTLTYWWLGFNMQDKILGNNKNLRLAIAHAVDVTKYIQVFTNNIGLKSNSIYPPGIPGYDPSSKLPYEYNLEKAKAFLTKAGYPDGKGLPALNYDVRGTSATNKQQGEFIKTQLEKLGIQVNVILNTFPSFLKKSKNGKLQFWQDGWALDYPDAENVLQLLVTKNHSPGPNSTYYSNPKFDKLFNELKKLPEGPKKHKLMKEMEKYILEDLPWVMQYFARNYILHHDRLKNFRHSDLIYNHMKYLEID